MRKYLKLAALAAAALMLIPLCGCKRDIPASPEELYSRTSGPTAEPHVMFTPDPNVTPDPVKGSNTMVVFFSASGNTRLVAQKIAQITGADVYEIVPVVPYSEGDLDYSNPETRATIEQRDPNFRPEIAGSLPDLAAYERVFLGYPIWWSEAPRILNTFVENVDFGSAAVIPFCTSGMSDIGTSADRLEELAGSGVWYEGKRFTSGVSRDELRAWITSVCENK